MGKYVTSLNDAQNTFTYKFIQNPIGTIRGINGETTNIYFVNPFEDFENDSLNLDNEGNPKENSGNKSINSGENVANLISKNLLNKKHSWLYVPFNFRQTDKKNDFIKALKEEFRIDIEIKNILEDLSKKDCNYKDIIQRIRTAYKKVPGNLNTNSMTLFSGTLENCKCIKQSNCNNDYCLDYCNNYHHCYCPGYYHGYCHYYPKYSHYDYYHHNGCLYTGDYNANGPQRFNQLKKAYQNYWNHIGCIQIPHHGSKYNYNEELIKSINKKPICVISAGIENKFGHPHKEVIYKINNEKVNLFIVNECINSEATMIINWY